MKQRRVAWAVAIAIVLGVVLWLRRGPDTHTGRDASGAPASASAGAPARATATPRAAAPPTHVTRLASPAERQAVADRIAAAHGARIAQAPPHPPSLPDDDHGHDLDRASATLRRALDEAIPFLAGCYRTGSDQERRPAVMMTLVGDPDVGTLIDAGPLLDPAGKPLDGELESCLRTTLGSLELPPLGSTEPIHIQYSFRFE